MPKLHLWGILNPKVVELATLAATLNSISGFAHSYSMRRTSKNRVLLTYSNPDEWAADHPISCYLPCYDQGESCWVVLDPTSYQNAGEYWEFDPHQAFSSVWMIDSWTNPNEAFDHDAIKRIYNGE